MGPAAETSRARTFAAESHEQAGCRCGYRHDVDSHGDRRDRQLRRAESGSSRACPRPCGWEKTPSPSASSASPRSKSACACSAATARCSRNTASSQPDQIRVVATSAVREARNRLAFIDRIYIATGLQVEPIDEAEVNRVTYLGVQPLLQAEPALAAARTLVVEVGGGSTEVLVVRGGNVVYANTLRLGSLRLRETLEAYRTPAVKVREIDGEPDRAAPSSR